MEANITLQCYSVNTEVIHSCDLLDRMDESIGKRLKRLRKEAGLTQAELAAKVGLGQSAIGNIEAGTRGYGASVVLIAEVLKTQPDFLQTISRTTRTCAETEKEPTPAHHPILPTGFIERRLSSTQGAPPDLNVAIGVLAQSLASIDPVDRAAAKAYLMGLCDAPERQDLLDKVRAVLEPPTSHQAKPEIGAKRTA